MSIELSEQTEIHLLERCRDGDHDAYKRIVEKYQTLICSITYSGCGDFAQSEDLAQETFVTVWGKLAELRELPKFKSWICTIARNTASRAFRKKGHNVIGRTVSLDDAPEVVSCQASPSEQLINHEQASLVWQSLEGIPENYREAMILFYREEQSIASVAEALELSQDAVKQRLSRGRKMVKSQLLELVELTLSSTRPSKIFTSSVVSAMSLSAMNAEAAAIGVGSAKAAITVGAGLWVTLLHLPIFVWAGQMVWKNARTPEERDLLKRLLLQEGILFILLIGAIFSSVLWSRFVSNQIIRSVLPAIIMCVWMIPHIFLCRRYGQRIEKMRKADGTWDEPLPITGEGPDSLSTIGVFWRLLLSLGLLLSWPTVLFISNGDIFGPAVNIALLLISAVAGTHLCKRFSAKYFQIFVVIMSTSMLCALAVMQWRRSGSDAPTWSMACMFGMVTTLFILNLLVWKRAYYRPDK